MKKLLVTGGAGFIGSNFIHYMMGKHPDLVINNYDKLTYCGNLKNLDGLYENPNYCWTLGDINDYEHFSKTVSFFKPDAIVHFAAESHVDRSIDSPQVFLHTNILGTDNVLRIVKEQKIPKLVHISTDEVYGSFETGEAAEDSPFNPNSPYSASKASGDFMCRAYHKTYGTPVVVIRGSNCYGPRQFPEKLIPRSLTNLMTSKKIAVYGRGVNVREWIYTEDFARGVEKALLKGVPGSIYNLGGGSENRVTNMDIVGELLRLTGNTQDAIEFVTDRAGHDLRYALNSNKIRNELGWTPKYSLAVGLRHTVTWYENNRDWWEPLL